MKFRLIFKSFNKEKINTISKKLQDTLLTLNCKASGIIALPIKIKKFCVLRSPHVNKDSREHFEIRIYKQFIDITADSTDIFNSLLNTSVPSEVSVSIKLL